MVRIEKNKHQILDIRIGETYQLRGNTWRVESLQGANKEVFLTLKTVGDITQTLYISYDNFLNELTKKAQ